MTSYTNIFTGNPVATSPTAYQAYTFSANTILSWPITNEDTANVAADIMEISTTSAGLNIAMPSANQVSNGQSSIIKNTGSNTFTITDANGGTIIAIAPGLVYWVYVRDNTTIQGIWGTFQYGASTSTANAAALAGSGMIAIGTTLNLQFPLTMFNSNLSVTSSYRANLLEWTGGAGTYSFVSSSVLGNGWFCLVKNSGTGTLTLAATDTIDGQSSIQLAPKQSCFVACSGTALYSVGLNQQSTIAYTRIVISVAGNSNLTLTPSQAAYSIIEFTGTLTGNIEVIVPTAVNIWWFYNNTTGSYTLTVQTSGGTGVTIPQSTRNICHCDGTNVVNSVNTTSGTVNSIATGTGLTGGPITTSGTISLANSGVSAGTYGTGNNLINIAVNLQGQITSASNSGVALLASNNLLDVISAASSLANLGGLSIGAAAATYAPLASPAFTGTPTAPTAALNTSTSELATCAFANPASSLSQTAGYVKLPSGLVIQWGFFTSSAAGYSFWTFPTAFATNPVFVTGILRDNMGFSGFIGWDYASSTTTQARIVTYNANNMLSSFALVMFAIGY